jgi:hypothetical protein
MGAEPEISGRLPLPLPFFRAIQLVSRGQDGNLAVGPFGRVGVARNDNDKK